MSYETNHLKLALLGISIFATSASSYAYEAESFSQLTSPKLQSIATSTISKFTQTPELTAVGNAKIEAQLTANGRQLTLNGQSSFHFVASKEYLEKGLVDVSAFNIALSDVPQEFLSWSGKGDKGSLGFVIKPGQSLRYDRNAAQIMGELSGFISADYMGQFAEPLTDADRDHNIAPRQSATININLKLSSPLEEGKADTPMQQKGIMSFDLIAQEASNLSAYSIELYAKPTFELESVFSFYFEAAKRLCVQPVRIAKWQWSWPYYTINYTGAGLAFGKPEATKQWNKADVTFTWRPWKTVFKSQFHTFSTSEANDLLDEVNDSDCVEVYFVNGDNGMHNNWGGGATFWSGEAYTKIISSDANASNGIDKVHLAHELGHALDLPHPNSFNASSTNTLMCPSGFLNDNPARNSQENKNNLSNPLLTFSLKAKSAGPDCNVSADCGYCP